MPLALKMWLTVSAIWACGVVVGMLLSALGVVDDGPVGAWTFGGAATILASGAAVMAIFVWL